MKLGTIGLGRVGANKVRRLDGGRDFSNQVLSAMRDAFGGHVEKPAGGHP